MIDVAVGLDVDAQRSLEVLFAKQIDNPAVVDDPLPHANLKFLRCRIAEVNVVNVGEKFFVVWRFGVAKMIMAGVKCQADAFDVTADNRNRVDVCRQAIDLCPHRDANTVGFGDFDKAFVAFDFFVERRPVLTGADRQRDDFGGFGQFAAFGKRLNVLFAGLFDVQVKSGDDQPMRVGAYVERGLKVIDDVRRFQVISAFDDPHFDMGEFQMSQLFDGLIKRQIGVALRSCGNKHTQTPFAQIGLVLKRLTGQSTKNGAYRTCRPPPVVKIERMSDFDNTSKHSLEAPLVAARGLSKSFGDFRALDGVELTIPKGVVFGLLGPNGAGKSTFIRCLLGFLQPSAGQATIAGLDCWRQRVDVHNEVSYLPGDARLPRTMRAKGLMRLFADLRPNGSYRRSLDVARRLELEAKRWVGLMSTGMKQKLALSIALSVDAPLLILDEPTANLDPTVRGEVLNLIREAKSNGQTVIFSSHVLSEIEDVCDSVAILKQGKLAFQQSLENMKWQHRIRAVTDEDVAARAVADGLAEQLSIVQDDRRVQIETEGDLSPVLKWLAEMSLRNVSVEPVGLRSIYDRIHLTKEVQV